MKIGAIVQARISSARLPGKVLMELPNGSGISVLEQIIKRLTRAEKVNEVIVATTTQSCDDIIVDLVRGTRVKCFRGSEDDVLCRYYFAAEENNLDVVVRVTGDCPCIDPEVVDLVVEKHIASKDDYTSNTHPKTFPHGLDTEVFNFGALEKAHLGAKGQSEREHVTLYMYSNPQIFNLGGVQAEETFYGPDIRITLDTKEDYALLCAVFDYLYPENKFFGTEDIIGLFRNKPWLKTINGNTAQKGVFTSLQQELKEAIRILDLQELKRAKELLLKYLR